MDLKANVTKHIWEGVEITVSIVTGWPIAEYCHIEIYCEEKLPITATGYRSHFMVLKKLEPYDSHIEFVTNWLDENALSKEWQANVEQSRQGDLFEL